MNAREYSSLKRACAKLPEGPDYRDTEYVICLLNTVLDFQMKVQTVEAATNHFREHHKKVKTDKALRDLLSTFDDDEDGNRAAARSLWGNNCWTRLGLLRALLTYLEGTPVNDFKSLRKWAHGTDFKDVAGRIRYHRHGIGPVLFQWLRLRTGAPTVKMDVWVKRFVGGAIDPAPSDDEAIDAIVRIAAELGRKPHELDAAIWHEMHDA